MASSKLVSDTALNSVTLATDISSPSVWFSTVFPASYSTLSREN
jgi:hypothetical protein